MRFLIDTHVFLWFINGDRRLSLAVRSAIEDVNNDVLLSIVSIWEIAIKTSIGKLQLAAPFAELIPTQIIENEIELLPIQMHALNIVATLPLYHRDPFDRLLIAQSMEHSVPFASDDTKFTAYEVSLFWNDFPGASTNPNEQ